MAPGRQLHLLPFAEGLQAELEQPVRLLLQGGELADYVFVEALLEQMLLDARLETFGIFLTGEVLNYLLIFTHRGAKLIVLHYFCKKWSLWQRRIKSALNFPK